MVPGGLQRVERGEAPRRASFDWSATLLLVVAANFPDADLVLGLVGPEAYLLWHRGLTHALAGLLIFPPALAALAHGLVPRLSFGRALLLCEAGFVSHIVLDVPTSWGTLLLYPWSHERFALGWVFIIDPVLWALPLFGVLLGLGRSLRASRRSAAGALLLSALHVLGAGIVHARGVEGARRALATANRGVQGEGRDRDGRHEAVSGGRAAGTAAAVGEDARKGAARDEAGRGDAPAEQVEVFPLPLSPFRWHAVAWSGDGLVHLSLSGIPPEITGGWREAHGLSQAAVRPALLTPAGQSFLWWAQVPAARVLRREGARTVVGLSDRRYAARGRDAFGMEVAIGDGGEYLGATWEGDSVFRR